MKSLSLFERCIHNSEQVSWTIKEILPDDYELSFDKKYVSSSMTYEEDFPELSTQDRLNLNHIWAASYLNLFAFVEEYITLFALNLANETTFENPYKLRAYVRFSEEEIKHQMLFRKFIEKFNKSFLHECKFLDNSQEVASIILSNSKLCVLILTYHLEIVTQTHYQESIKKNESLDEKFKTILKAHWMEESQHAKIDLLKLKEEYLKSENDDFLNAIDEYFDILEAFSLILLEQVKLNYHSLLNCSQDKNLIEDKKFYNKFHEQQLKSYIDCFIFQGIKNSQFIEEISNLSENGMKRINESFNLRFKQYL